MSDSTNDSPEMVFIGRVHLHDAIDQRDGSLYPFNRDVGYKLNLRAIDESIDGEPSLGMLIGDNPFKRLTWYQKTQTHIRKLHMRLDGHYEESLYTREEVEGVPLSKIESTLVVNGVETAPFITHIKSQLKNAVGTNKKTFDLYIPKSYLDQLIHLEE